MYKPREGDLVISLCGHDAGEYFIVLKTDGDCVTICDGKKRKAEKGKRKKIKQL